MKPEGDPVQMNWIIQFYPKIGLDGATLGTSQTKKYKCIGSNMVNHAQDWSWVKIFFDLPNKHIPNYYYIIHLSISMVKPCRVKWRAFLSECFEKTQILPSEYCRLPGADCVPTTLDEPLVTAVQFILTTNTENKEWMLLLSLYYIFLVVSINFYILQCYCTACTSD